MSVIRELKALIGQVSEKTPREFYTFSMLPRGIPRGALIELTGVGKTEVMVKFLAENPQKSVAWIEDDLTIYPCAVAQRKGVLPRLLFVEAHKELFWATFQVLRSSFFECVVISSTKTFDERNLRRLQLESEKGHVAIFLLTEKKHQAWPISLQLQVKRKDDFYDLEILKERA